MLHTKFQGHRPFGSGEEDFWGFLPYMGMAAILVMWPGPFEQTLIPPSQRGSIWNLASISPVVSAEKMFENVDNKTHIYIPTDGRQRPTYTISSPMSFRWAKNPFLKVLRSFPSQKIKEMYWTQVFWCCFFNGSSRIFFTTSHFRLRFCLFTYCNLCTLVWHDEIVSFGLSHW